jgi:hypothetical protein
MEASLFSDVQSETFADILANSEAATQLPIPGVTKNYIHAILHDVWPNSSVADQIFQFLNRKHICDKQDLVDYAVGWNEKNVAILQLHQELFSGPDLEFVRYKFEKLLRQHIPKALTFQRDIKNAVKPVDLVVVSPTTATTSGHRDLFATRLRNWCKNTKTRGAEAEYIQQEFFVAGNSTSSIKDSVLVQLTADKHHLEVSCALCTSTFQLSFPDVDVNPLVRHVKSSHLSKPKRSQDDSSTSTTTHSTSKAKRLKQQQICSSAASPNAQPTTSTLTAPPPPLEIASATTTTTTTTNEVKLGF